MSDDLVDVHNAATEFEDKMPGAAEEEQAQAFLDAVTLRSRGEFDPALAKTMYSVLGQAIRMVEAGTVEADKATPGGVSSLPGYTDLVLKGGRIHKYLPDKDLTSFSGHHNVLLDKSLMQIDLHDNWTSYEMSVRPGSESQRPPSNEPQAKDRSAGEEGLSPARIFVAGGIPIAFTAVGVLLAVGSAVTNPVKPNPYIAMSVLIAGIGLILTAIVALRERRDS